MQVVYVSVFFPFNKQPGCLCAVWCGVVWCGVCACREPVLGVCLIILSQSTWLSSADRLHPPAYLSARLPICRCLPVCLSIRASFLWTNSRVPSYHYHMCVSMRLPTKMLYLHTHTHTHPTRHIT